MKILGISCFYHESAACLLEDGIVTSASAEERFSRIKHDYSFPKLAIDFCLKRANIKSQGLDYVVFYEKPFIKFERNLRLSLQYFPKSSALFIDSMKNFLTEKLWIKTTIASKLKIDPKRILFVPHHLSHAAASYYASPYNSAAFLTLDGVGEWTCGSFGFALGNKIYPKYELRFPHSIGLLYSTFTAFLGFEVNDGEYKVMGMAAYGKAKHKDRIKKLYKQYKDGSIQLNLDYFSFQYSPKGMYTKKFVKEFSSLDKFDLAASIQECTQELVLNLINYIYKKTKKETLVFGGGVALNSVINGKITDKTKFKNVFIFPAAGDDGGAVGASYYVYHHVLGFKKKGAIEDVFWGQEYDNVEIESFLKIRKIKYQKLGNNALIKKVASKLSAGKVIGWFEGRAEFGPRALGHRSILANPGDSKMKDIVNSKIKFREEFRPFAPAVLAEKSRKYFKNIDKQLGPFMLGTYEAKPLGQKKAPAVVHEDGSSRLQLVGRDYHGKFRKLLQEYGEKTGLPILLNTSFNLKGEPIVNSPEDAYKTFLNSGLDLLILENYLVEKR